MQTASALTKPEAVSLESAFRHQGEYKAFTVTGVDIIGHGKTGRRSAYVYMQSADGKDWYLSFGEDEGRRIRNILEIAGAGGKVLMAFCTNTRHGLDTRFAAVDAEDSRREERTA